MIKNVTTSHARRFAVGLGAVGMALLAVPGSAAAGPDSAGASRVAQAAAVQPAVASGLFADRQPIPANLVPPAGNVLDSVFQARGVQVYRCTTTESTPPGNPTSSWLLLEPAATLTGAVRGSTRPVTAIHFRGPSWQSDQDGSLVEGTARANSPVPGSIPQLLIQSKRNQGTGVFGRTTFIQRLATNGGTAPAGSCTEGATASVPYGAVYRFFVAAA